MYNFKKENGVLIISFKGLFKMEEAESFVKDYENEIRGLNLSATSLILDGKDLACSFANTIPMLAKCVDKYIEDGYKKIIQVKFNKIVGQMQFNNIIKGKPILVVDTLEEALRKAKE